MASCYFLGLSDMIYCHFIFRTVMYILKDEFSDCVLISDLFLSVYIAAMFCIIFCTSCFFNEINHHVINCFNNLLFNQSERILFFVIFSEVEEFI